MSRGGPLPFQYKGSGKVQAKDADAGQRECTKLACNIQYCLQRFNHQQSKCQDVIEVWRECTERANAEAAAISGAGATVVASAAALAPPLAPSKDQHDPAPTA